MDYIDVKYINLLSSRLDKFKRVKPNLYNFRCPICGDSKKNRTKARGYVYQVKNNTNFKCHNCGVNISFNNFLKELDPTLQKEYTLEKFKEGNIGKGFSAPKPEDVFSKLKTSKPSFKKMIDIDLPYAFDFDESRRFLHDRAIFEGEFFYAEKFKEFCNQMKPGSFESLDYEEPRIVIPLVREGKLIGFQGRCLKYSSVKYLTIMLNEDEPKIYGMDKVDRKKPVYVVEGPLDSTFIDNSVAFCGSDGDVSCLGQSDLIFVYDNEPRNKEIVARIQKCVDHGDRVVIWPSSVNEKDINDMVLAGRDVKKLVSDNTYQGLQAKLNLTTWRRV